jgi:hypothetical protein
MNPSRSLMRQQDPFETICREKHISTVFADTCIERLDLKKQLLKRAQRFGWVFNAGGAEFDFRRPKWA